MSFFLKGPRWVNGRSDPNARGAILLIANVGGRRYCLSTRHIDVYDFASKGGTYTDNWMQFVGAITNSPSHRESVDVFGGSASVSEMSFEVLADHFPIYDMRRARIVLQDINVDVYWHVEGVDHGMDQALHLISGKLLEPFYDEENGIVSFRVEDKRLLGDRRFPPIVASQDLITALHEDHQGAAYPIVIGACKKVPCLNVDNANDDLFLAMGDPLKEFAGLGLASDIYQDDDSLGLGAETVQTDSDGNQYYRIATAAPATSRDVTADITGHTPATVGEVIRYLLNFLGDDKDLFQMHTLPLLDSKLSGLTLAMVINQRGRGGVLQLIRGRLVNSLPIMMIQRGGKFEFKALTWDHDIKKILSYERGNLFRKVAGPTESRRSEVFNEFVVRYGISGLRGDTTGVATRNPETNYSCKVSADRYGRRAMGDIDGGDLADQESAEWLANWAAETYSKMRLFVSYDCDLDTADLQLWDSVRAIDTREGWDAEFKVIGTTRKDEKTIRHDLVGAVDISEMYIPPPEILSEPYVAEDTPSAWDSWWHFRGTFQLGDALELADNVDFEIESDWATWYIGIEPDFTAGATEYLFYKNDDYYGKLVEQSAAPGLQRFWEGRVRLDQGAASVLARKGDLQIPGERTLLAVTWKHSTKTIYVKFVDSTGVYTAETTQPRVAPTMDNANPLRIACGELGATNFFFGKIFFFSWYKGQNLFAEAEDVYNEVITPQSLGPTCQINFARKVEATYLAEVGTGPNAPYVWDVLGTPVLNGP